MGYCNVTIIYCQRHAVMWFRIIIPLLFSFSAMGQSDKYLILEHRSKPKEVVIEEGEYVFVKTFKGEKVKGRMLVLSESLIKVKHKVVPLTNVQKIGKRNPYASQIGSAIFSMGMNLVLFGIQSDLKNGWKEPDDNYVVSIPFLSSGSALLFFHRKRTSKNWTFKGQMPGW